MTFVLSDLDGVLVDSGDAVERVWRAWAVERGVDPELVVRTSHGVPARGVLERVAPHLLSAAARLRAAGLPTPRVLITSDMTERGKPHPDPYLAGAAAFSADPADCVVIEDAPAGIAAGRAAGMRVWAVTTTHAPHELLADLVGDNLAELLQRMPISDLSPTMNR